ncbi:hypothetical protein TomMM35A_23160 [Sphingobium sp. TomMM35A]
MNEEGEHFLGSDLGDRPIADFWKGHADQPTNLAEPNLGDVLALVLGGPLLCDRLESVVLLDARLGPRDFPLARRWSLAPEARFVAPAVSVGEADLGPGAEGQLAVLAKWT